MLSRIGVATCAASGMIVVWTGAHEARDCWATRLGQSAQEHGGFLAFILDIFRANGLVRAETLQNRAMLTLPG